MSKPKSKQAKKPQSGGEHTSFIIQSIWITALTVIIVVGVLFLFISKALLPDTSELENPKYDLATLIISADNKEIGKAFTKNREWLTYEEINPLIVKALIATEDERFFSHSGIDMKGTLRAVVYMGSRGGASTITQQLAKLFFTEKARSFIPRVWQKLKEWVIAIEFEKRYTKEEIIAMYLNKHDFIYESIGVATAAKTYFGKNQKDLDVDEAAILIGMLKSPYYFNPKIFPERALGRRNIVLKQMNRNDYLTDESYSVAASKSIDMSRFSREQYSGGLAPYFRAELVKWVKGLLDDPAYSKPDGTKYNIYTDGLKIYTTIDSRVQKHGEEAMRRHMANLQKKYFDVWGKSDPWTSNGFGRATAEERAQRDRYLNADIRNSELFRMLRESYMGNVSAAILKEIPGARLNDIDIFRLFNAASDKNSLRNGIKQGLFSKDQADVYEQILTSSHWTKLKSQWEKLREKSDRVFSTPKSMRIYDYETGGEKVVKMSPLDSIKYHQQILQIGSVALDAKTGNVLGWIGGVDHRNFQYDHVTSNRQVGSTFKPFIYATAIIDQAMSPCTKLQDVKTCIPANDPNFGLMSTWCPENSTGKYSGETMNLRRALEKSTNTISVQLMKEIGNVERVRDFVGNLGIDINKIPSQPSICLGTPGLSALDMAGAYTTFANNGTYSKPNFVSRIEDKDGRIIYTSVPEQKKAINAAFNHVIVDLLMSVFSTSPVSSQVKSKVGGKTGTTNDYRDGWFVGFTPEIIISTWVGGDKEFIRFFRLSEGQGGVMARPMFISWLSKIENDKYIGLNTNADFEAPEEPIVELDCSKYEDIISKDKEAANKTEEFDEEF